MQCIRKWSIRHRITVNNAGRLHFGKATSAVAHNVWMYVLSYYEVFKTNGECQQCGFSLEQTVPENLAEIFAQKMSFSSYAGKSVLPVHSPVSTIQDGSKDTNFVYSISQHYHHSAHVARAPSDISLPNTVISSTSLERPSTTDILIQNGVEPSSLLRSQVALFESSNDEQRERLLAFWRLAPPNYTANGGQELADRLGEYQVMTMEQEEELAFLRHQRNTQSKDESRDDLDMDQDSGFNSPFVGEVGEDCNTVTLGSNVSLQASNAHISPLENEALIEIPSHHTSSDLFAPANDYWHGNMRPNQQDSIEYPGWQLGQQYVEHQYGMFDQMNR